MSTEAEFIHYEYGVRRHDTSVMRDSRMSRKEAEDIADRHGFTAVVREVLVTGWEPVEQRDADWETF